MGGGILVSGPGMSLTISDSKIFDSSGVQGGGIANRGGTLTVVRSTLTGNRAGGATDGGEGGGIYSVGTTTVLNSTISANTAANGEVASARGGGIQVNAGTFTVESTTLAGNVADVGTAIHRSGGTLTLVADDRRERGSRSVLPLCRRAVRRCVERRRATRRVGPCPPIRGSGRSPTTAGRPTLTCRWREAPRSTAAALSGRRPARLLAPRRSRRATSAPSRPAARLAAVGGGGTQPPPRPATT